MRPEDQLKAGVRYTVIPRVLIFLLRDEEILLLRGAPDKKLWAGQYNGLGGHVEPGETPYQAAMRELAEEAGLRVARLDLRGVVHITMPQPPGVVLFVFTGHDPSGTLRPSIEGTPVWVRRDAWRTLPLVEDLPLLLPRVLAAGPPVFTHYRLTEAGLEVTFD